MKRSRNSLDPYPQKYGPQDVRRNFERNMERNCKGGKKKMVKSHRRKSHSRKVKRRSKSARKRKGTSYKYTKVKGSYVDKHRRKRPKRRKK